MSDALARLVQQVASGSRTPIARVRFAPHVDPTRHFRNRAAIRRLQRMGYRVVIV